MFSYSTSRSSRPEVVCIKVILKIAAIFTGKHLHWSIFLIKLQGLQHRIKETATQVFSAEYCGVFKNSFFIEHFWWLLLNFFTGCQKETVFSINHSVMKTFKCSFPIHFAFNMSIRCLERTQQPEIILYSMDFLAVIICKKRIAFTCVNPPSRPLCFYSLSLFLLFHSLSS